MPALLLTMMAIVCGGIVISSMCTEETLASANAVLTTAALGFDGSQLDSIEATLHPAKDTQSSIDYEAGAELE